MVGGRSEGYRCAMFANTSLECSMLKLLAGNVAVVTGASSGIGRAIALTFANEGARVVLADVVTEPLEGGDTTLDLILRSGGEAFFEHCDVGQWKQVDGLIGATVARYGRLDVMVNNAAAIACHGGADQAI